MGVLGKDKILQLITDFKCIHPFNPSFLDGDGYILTVKEDTVLNYLQHKNLISHEIIFTPPNYVAHLTAKSKYGRLGLSFLNAAKVHSGFVGRLALEIVNLNNERIPITINHGDPFMHVEFISREGNPSPYDGGYMFQYMNDEEISIYSTMLLNKFKKIFDKNYIEKMVSSRLK
jgi:dCTP deaminase